MHKIFRNQAVHLAVYILLGGALLYYSNGFMNHTTVFGLSAGNWILLSWIAAGIFQAWILLFWRLELYYNKISGWFGNSAFTIYRIGFIVFGSIRLLPLIPISFLTRNSIEIDDTFKIIVIVVTTLPILWAMYSVAAYFGINRAFGADHFFYEYRMKPLERRGTFKYIPNSMYTLVLLLLYHPGLFYESSPGLVTALIHHTFVWTHYFCTEKPDLKEMYGT